MRICVLIPALNEDKTLEENMGKLARVLDGAGVDFRVILADDGSYDGTWSAMQRVCAADGRFSALSLSRNFGKEAAICAALHAAAARQDWDYCLVMDSDLQHPPAAVREMLSLACETGANVVDGVKAFRGRETAIYRLFTGMFYSLLRTVCGIDMRASSDFKLLDRISVERLCSLRDSAPFFRGMCRAIGGRHVSYEFSVEQRLGDVSRFSKLRLIRFALTAMISEGDGPLRLLMYLGGGSAAIGFAGSIAAVIAVLCGASPLWLVAALTVFFGGACLAGVGLAGQYAARACADAAAHPQFIVGDRTDNI